MQIETSPYELIARADGRRREGVLLRVTFEDGVRGYGDLHPWAERGDAPLNRQLAALANGTPEPLASRSLALARVASREPVVAIPREWDQAEAHAPAPVFAHAHFHRGPGSDAAPGGIARVTWLFLAK